MTTTTVHPYFTYKARAAFERAGGDPGRSGPLAAWAEQARRVGDPRVGVIVAETGEVLAETRRPWRNQGTSYVVAVTHETDSAQTARESGLATEALRRAHGPTIHVRYSEVCQGPGEGR